MLKKADVALIVKKILKFWLLNFLDPPQIDIASSLLHKQPAKILGIVLYGFVPNKCEKSFVLQY